MDGRLTAHDDSVSGQAIVYLSCDDLVDRTRRCEHSHLVFLTEVLKRRCERVIDGDKVLPELTR